MAANFIFRSGTDFLSLPILFLFFFTASEMTYTVSGGALNSTQSNLVRATSSEKPKAFQIRSGWNLAEMFFKCKYAPSQIFDLKP